MIAIGTRPRPEEGRVHQPDEKVRTEVLQGRALVTGASGFIGYHVAAALKARGLRVRALVRPTSPTHRLRALGIDLCPGDVTDPESLKRALDGCDYLFHVAALYTFSAPDPREVYRTNIDGTQVALEAGRHLRRIVYTSTVGALGLTTDGTPSDEETPVSEDDMVGHYKKSKFQAEEIARRLAREGAAIVIVNPTAPVGPGDVKPTPTGGMILDYMRGKMSAYVETGLNLVAVEDVAEGHCLAAERGRFGERYILGNSNLHLREIFGELEKITGIRAPNVRVPHWVPLAAAWVSTSWAKMLGRTPALSLEQVRLSQKYMYFSSAKAIRELGLPQTSPSQALERAVRWYRENGYLDQGDRQASSPARPPRTRPTEVVGVGESSGNDGKEP
jgi:dihydroflavonol-4-reductase